MKYTRNGNRDHDIHSFVPSFEWLRPGDRIGLKKAPDSKVLIYYNSEILDMCFEKVPDVSSSCIIIIISIMCLTAKAYLPHN